METIRIGRDDVQASRRAAQIWCKLSAQFEDCEDLQYIRDTAEEQASNGLERLCRWPVTDDRSLYLFIDDGVPETLTLGPADMEAHIRELSYDDLDEAEWMTAWGYDGLDYLTKAAEDYDGPCRIWRSHCYYQGTFDAPLDGYERDESGETMEFDTRAEAEAYVNEWRDAPSQYDGIPARNVLAHGQAGSDELTIVQAGTGDIEWCESCMEAGQHRPATTRSTNPSYSDYALCAQCARHYDGEPDVQAPDRDD